MYVLNSTHSSAWLWIKTLMRCIEVNQKNASILVHLVIHDVNFPNYPSLAFAKGEKCSSLSSVDGQIGVTWTLTRTKVQKRPLTENSFFPLATQKSFGHSDSGSSQRPKDARIYSPRVLIFSMPRNNNPFDDENINPTAVLMLTLLFLFIFFRLKFIFFSMKISFRNIGFL